MPRRRNHYGGDGGNKNARQARPINSTISVQISEAHAWDSTHIQELTEKVADQIKPAIESALNSNSNSY